MLCLLLIISMLATSTPAAPQAVTGIASGWHQSFAFWYYSSGWSATLNHMLMGYFLPDEEPEQEDQTTRDASVTRIQIDPGDSSIMDGESIAFSAIAFGTNATGEDVPVSGVDFTWQGWDVNRNHAVEVPEGVFRATIDGTFMVKAEGAGHQAQVTVTVTRYTPPGATNVQSSQASIAPGGSIGEGGGTVWWRDDPGNGRGNPPGRTTGNSNFQITAPVLSLPGRGIDLSLALVYNSRLWNKSGSNIIFDVDQDWPAPGWSLGFGKLVGMGVDRGSMLVDADGTRHGYQGAVTYTPDGYTHFEGHTTDGTFIDYQHNTGDGGRMTWAQALLPNGTIIEYGARGSKTGALYPIQITDANGNYITITYLTDGNGGEIKSISDTLGRSILFNYDSNKLLTSIEAPDFKTTTKRTLVRIHYKQLTLSYGFQGLTPKGNDTNNGVVPQSIWTIDAIYYKATGTGYWFGDGPESPESSYSTYGMIRKVSERRGMVMSLPTSGYEQGTVTNVGTVTRESLYNYPKTRDTSLTDAPTFGTLSETWAGMENTSEPAVTNYETTESGSERVMTVTGPKGKNGLRIRSVQHSIKHSGNFDDGLVNQGETYEVNGTTQTLIGKSLVYWEQGQYESPRPKSIEVWDERNQMTKTDLDYGPSDSQLYNQVKESRSYDYGGTKLIQATVTEYENSDNYKRYRHIFNLVKSVEIWSSANGTTKTTRESRTEYQYDGNEFPQTDGKALKNASGVGHHLLAYNPYAPTRIVPGVCEIDCYPIPGTNKEHCEETCEPDSTISDYNPATDYRGNVTRVTKYADAANLSDPVVERRGYDITGNLVVASTACCEQTTYNYTTATKYAYPSSMTRGSATETSKRITTSSTYDLNTGLVISATDANGRKTLTDYFTEMLRPKAITAPAKTPVSTIFPYTGVANTAFTYDDVAMTVTEVTKTDTGNVASQNVKYLNGLGQVIKEQALGVNNVWDIVETRYDNLGLVWKQTRPYRSNETPQWSETTYDVQGRVTKVVSPDGSQSLVYYNESSYPSAATADAPGETMRIVDAWGRERWGRSDILGHLVEVVEPDPDGNGKVAANGLVTKYTYDALGNLTQVDQGPQQRFFKYDSLGRKTRQKLAEANATLNDAGEYVGVNGAGAHWSDAFNYDERSNLVSRMDARGVKTIFDYNNDPLNRLYSMSFDVSGPHETTHPILPAAQITYEYMTAGDRARLSKVTTAGVSTEIYSYDTEGRLKEKKLTLTSRPSFPMVTGYVYDSLDRVEDVYYPAEYGVSGAPRKVVHQDYDVAGRASGLTVDGASYASQITYNAASQTASLNVGASISETYDYDDATGLLKNQKILRGSSTLLDLSYDYLRTNTTTGRTGQLTRILNNKDHNRDRGYEYDQLGRLTKATGGKSGSSSLWTQTYTYDRFGNRKTVTAAGVAANFVEPTATAPPYEEAAQTPDTSGQNGNNQNSSTGQQAPPPGSTFFEVPEVIQAENFGNGGVEGASYSDSTAANLGDGQYRSDTDVDILSDNQGGYYIGYTEAGEWLDYPINIAVSDTYNIEAQVANSGADGSFHIEISKVGNADPAQVYNTGAMSVPATGAETTFQTVSKTGVQLSAGRYLMRVVMDTVSTAGGAANFDYFKITPSSPSTHHTPFDFDGDGKTDVATYKPAASITEPNV